MLSLLDALPLYFLGRTDSAQDRPADAAKVFERTVAVAGRQPELLGQWAQAQYFADGKKWSDKVQALTDEALKLDPKEVTSLGLLGIAAFDGERYQIGRASCRERVCLYV